MALKKSSEIIKVGFSITESGANTFTQERVDLQLNPLDNEVFVVVAADLDPASPFFVDLTNTQTAMSVSSTSRTDLANLNSATTIANAVIDLRASSATPGAAVSVIRTSLDSPPAALDYIHIISTNDFFVQIEGTGNTGARNGFGALWGYRAKADAATYAALVQSEVLSS
jgi:hypothetical protein